MKLYLLGIAALMATGCGRAPIDYLRADILSYHFIPYDMPLADSGTGTLVGGAPNAMVLVAPPDTCFPQEIQGVKTGLRVVDETDLPSHGQTVSVDAEAKVGLFDALKNGNGVISARAGISNVKSVEFSYTRPHREYFDSIKLTDYYRTKIPEACKDYLDKVGFISEAVKVDEMHFKFFSSSTTALDLTVPGVLGSLVDISIGTSWQVMNKSELVISTPKYLGYRLGRLTRKDGGMSLCRSAEVKDNKFEFQCIDLFPEQKLEKLSTAASKPGNFFKTLQAAPEVPAHYRTVDEFQD